MNKQRKPFTSKVIIGPRPRTRFNQYVEKATEDPIYGRIGDRTVCVLKLRANGQDEPLIGVGFATRLENDKPNMAVAQQVSYGRAAKDLWLKMRRETP